MQWKLAIGVVVALGAMSAPLSAQAAGPEATAETVDSSYFSTAWEATRAEIDSTIAPSLRAFNYDSAFVASRPVAANAMMVRVDMVAVPGSINWIMPTPRKRNVNRAAFGVLRKS